jgi:hypothetical protein
MVLHAGWPHSLRLFLGLIVGDNGGQAIFLSRKGATWENSTSSVSTKYEQNNTSLKQSAKQNSPRANAK